MNETYAGLRGIPAVILCAGAGTRMNDPRTRKHTHKVCYEIAGVPTIKRLIANLRAAGVNRFVVVVGSKAEMVMQCLDGEDGVIYAYQPRQDGTGSAALYGLKALGATGYAGAALVVMGDKVIAPDVVSTLISTYNDQGARAALAVQPMAFNRSGGRIVVSPDEPDRVLGIVERMDSALMALGALPDRSREALERAVGEMDLGVKGAKLLARAEEMAKLPDSVELCGRRFTSKDIEAAKYVNTATYVFDSALARDMLSSLGSDNAQGEIYLTDAVNSIAERYPVVMKAVDAPEKLLTYSTYDDLLRLQKYFISPNKPRRFALASQRLASLRAWGAETRARFEAIYGNDEKYLAERRSAYASLLEAFIAKYGDREVAISRAPGRVNLMGRHIEHRGGSVNVMSVNRETLAVAAAREDDRVHIANMSADFKEYEFSILSEISAYDTDNWVDFIESDSISSMVMNTRGEWVNYVKAGLLRLQLDNNASLLCGMDMLFTGDIPIAAGLSSSSSIVVATAEAALAINGIDMDTKHFISLCGEGEWFVGSRGGAGDHAAMKCGRRNMLTRLDFCPFEINESIEFPDNYQVVVANSYVKAAKSAGAKDQFNQKVASYEFGFMLVKRLYPQYADRLKYLRDINPANLGITQSAIYEMLLNLPERMTSEEIYASLPECAEQIARIQRSHAAPEYYDIRATMLYGIAECARAAKCLDMLKRRDYAAFGRLMSTSHDGDRVEKDGAPFDYSCTDAYLYRLIADLKSEDVDKVSVAQLYNQPGGYACSTPTIDAMVDYVNTREGVVGCELSGAGLGGCIIILVEKSKTEALLADLKEWYYDKRGLPMGADVFLPVTGSCVI